MKIKSTAVVLIVLLLLINFVQIIPGEVMASELKGKTSVKVAIVWDDSENPTCSRSEFVTVKLFANDVNTGKTLTLSDSNSWAGEFTELDEYEDGEKIVYTIEECNVCDDYSCVVTGDAATGYTITNCSAMSCISITIPDTGESKGFSYQIGLVLLVAGGLLVALVVRRIRMRSNQQ